MLWLVRVPAVVPNVRLLGSDLRLLPAHSTFRWSRARSSIRPFLLVEQMESGRLEGIVLKDRTSRYRDGTRVGWSKVKDRSWHEREAWRLDRR